MLIVRPRRKVTGANERSRNKSERGVSWEDWKAWIKSDCESGGRAEGDDVESGVMV